MLPPVYGTEALTKTWQPRCPETDLCIRIPYQRRPYEEVRDRLQCNLPVPHRISGQGSRTHPSFHTFYWRSLFEFCQKSTPSREDRVCLKSGCTRHRVIHRSRADSWIREPYRENPVLARYQA